MFLQKCPLTWTIKNWLKDYKVTSSSSCGQLCGLDIVNEFKMVIGSVVLDIPNLCKTKQQLMPNDVYIIGDENLAMNGLYHTVFLCYANFNTILVFKLQTRLIFSNTFLNIFIEVCLLLLLSITTFTLTIFFISTGLCSL